MERLSWPDRLLAMAGKKEEEGDLSRAKEDDQLFPLIQTLIGKICSVLGAGYMTVEALSDVMDTGLESLGLGLPPLYFLAKRLPVKPQVLLGFGSKKDAVYLDEFRALGASVTVCTADGSLGEKGLVTDLLPRFDSSFFYACGPLPMAEALCREAAGPGQISLEARMGCGFGACMGCTIETVSGPRRVCKDGPVFEKEALVWQTRE